MNERFSCIRLSLFPRWKEKIEDFEKDKLSFSTVSEFDASGLGERIVVPIMPFYDYRCEFMIRTI